MNRRGFLRGVGALAVAAPVAPAALSAAVNVGQGAGSVLGGGWVGGAIAGGGAMVAGETCIPATGLAALIYAAHNRVELSSAARLAWYEIYRAHRVSVRRGRVPREPAKLVWLRHELKLKRCMEANRNSRGNYSTQSSSRGQFGARSKRFAWHRVRARQKAAMRRMGFDKMPWEIY